MELMKEHCVEPRIWLTSFGGAGGEVTGSMHLVAIEVKNKRYFGLLDAGLVQGEAEYRNAFFPMDGKQLDFVVVTHGHSDHFLGLPLLKEFQGKVYGTQETFSQGHELMLDAVSNYERKSAANMQLSREEFKELRRKFWNIINHPENVLDKEENEDIIQLMAEIRANALYTKEDVDRIEQHFCPVLPYTNIKIDQDVVIRLIPSSTHQNGAVYVELYVGGYGKKSVSLCFSGDIGPQESLLYRPMRLKHNPLIQYCAIEGTHGIEEKSGFVKEAVKKTERIVFDAIKHDKTLIFVGFSLDRIPKLLYTLNHMIDKYGIQVPIILDAPLAWRLLLLYQNFYRNAKGESDWFKDLGYEPFDTNEVWVTNRTQDHMDAMYLEGPKIVLTAQAFGEGGRVLDYFDAYVQDDNAIFVFAAWLSPSCTSSKLLHAKRMGKVVLHGKTYVKHCETVQIEGHTSHGYFGDYCQFIEQYPHLKGLSVVHVDAKNKDKVVEKYSNTYDFPVVAPDLFDTEKSNKNVVEYTPHEMKTHSRASCLAVFDSVLP